MIVERTTTEYVTEDGKVFSSKKDAEIHQLSCELEKSLHWLREDIENEMPWEDIFWGLKNNAEIISLNLKNFNLGIKRINSL